MNWQFSRRVLALYIALMCNIHIFHYKETDINNGVSHAGETNQHNKSAYIGKIEQTRNVQVLS